MSKDRIRNGFKNMISYEARDRSGTGMSPVLGAEKEQD